MVKSGIFWRFMALVLAGSILIGCGEKEEGLGRYGMLDENTPEYAAVAFMYSVYGDDTIDSAVKLSSDRMARMIERYHSNRNVQRHIIDLRYDKNKVTVTPNSSSRVGRNEYADEATVTLFYSGTYNGDKIEDLRTVELIRENGNWKVDRVHPDHFM